MQSQKLVTFETLITFLTIENNNINIHSDPWIKSDRDSIRNSCDVLFLVSWEWKGGLWRCDNLFAHCAGSQICNFGMSFSFGKKTCWNIDKICQFYHHSRKSSKNEWQTIRLWTVFAPFPCKPLPKQMDLIIVGFPSQMKNGRPMSISKVDLLYSRTIIWKKQSGEK